MHFDGKLSKAWTEIMSFSNTASSSLSNLNKDFAQVLLDLKIMRFCGRVQVALGFTESPNNWD